MCKNRPLKERKSSTDKFSVNKFTLLGRPRRASPFGSFREKNKTISYDCFYRFTSVSPEIYLFLGKSGW
jgi:hypothetical protein